MKKIKKLNIGCGKLIVKEWINIDLFNFNVPKDIEKNNILQQDIRQGVPFKNNTIENIYSSHFIEHLNFEQVLIFFKECFRVMNPGGIIRISCPDLRILCKKYIEKDKKFFQHIYKHWKSFSSLETNGDILVGQIMGWGHKWAFDFDSLKKLLATAKFRKIEKKKCYQSKLKDIKKLEPCWRKIESLYVEAVK